MHPRIKTPLLRVMERYAAGWYDPRKNFVRFRPVFPRTKAEKEARMTRHLEWRRQQIQERMVRRLLIGFVIAAGTPLAIVVTSWLWRWAVVAVAG